MNFETVRLTSSDGVILTADMISPADPEVAAVVAHPHPLYGGDRHNHVVDGVWRGLGHRDVCSVRFDFRGAGDSQGRHEGGTGERLDVVAAVDLLSERHAGVPVWLVGYSFGALVVAEITDERVAGWVLIAPPLGLGSSGRQPRSALDMRPTVIVVPEHDEFCSPACIEQQCAGWANVRHEVIAHATHGLVAQGTTVAQNVLEVISANSAGPTPQQPPR